MKAVIRRLRGRGWSLIAVAVTVAVAAGFAALAGTAWSVGLPRAASADLVGAPQAGMVVSRQSGAIADVATIGRRIDAAVATGGRGTFAVSQVLISNALALPTSSGTSGERLTYAVSSPDALAHAVLVDGSWPQPVAGGRAIPVALPLPALRQLGLHIGDDLPVTDTMTRSPVTFEVVGVYQRSVNDPAFWLWDQIGPSGVTLDVPDTLYGPLVVAPATDAPAALATGSTSWVITPRTGADLAAVDAGATTLGTALVSDPGAGYSVSTGLPDVVNSLNRRLVAARAQLLATCLLIAVLAGAALASAAGHLVTRNAIQAAMLRSRGAGRGALVSGYLLEIAVLCGAAVAGVLVAAAAPWQPGPGRGFGAPPVAWFAAAGVVVVATTVVCWRAARPNEPGAATVASGRQTSVPALVSAGADLAVAGIAVIALWQASQAGLTARTTDGGAGVVLGVAVAPALATAAGAALSGRLVTGVARLSEHAAEHARRLPIRLAAWELARTPLRYLMAALLCVAAVSGCGYVIAARTSWQRSATDQAAYTVGADVAVDLPQAAPIGGVTAIVHRPGVLSATPVTRVSEGSATLIAVDARTAAASIALRPDLADRPIPAFWAALASPAPVGISLAGQPSAIGLTASLSARGLSAPDVAATVEDATGLSYSVDLGPLPADGRPHTLNATVAPTGQAAYPLRIVSIALSYRAPSTAAVRSRLTITALTARQVGASTVVPVPGDALRSFAVATRWSAAENQCAVTDPTPIGITATAVASSDGWSIAFTSGAGLDWTINGTCRAAPIDAGITLSAGDPKAFLPAAATRAYLTANGLHVGAVTTVTVDGGTVPIRIVAALSAFPTVSPTDPSALIVDEGQLSEIAARNNVVPPPVTTWWLRTAHGTVPEGLPPGSVTASTAGARVALLDDPLAALPQRVLLVGAVALVLLALLGLLVSLAVSARDAAARDMVLGALGATRGQRAALACLLHTAVVVPAVILGAVLGVVLARILVPLFVLAPDATAPLPPARVFVNAPWSILTGTVIVAVTVAAALSMSLRRGDPLRLARTGG